MGIVAFWSAVPGKVVPLGGKALPLCCRFAGVRRRASMVPPHGPLLAWEQANPPQVKERPMLLMALIQGVAGTAALMPPARLQAQVEAFAGKPALVDPRLLLPACAQPEMAFAVTGRSVMVRCASPEWRVFVPVGEGGSVDAPAPARQTIAEAPGPAPGPSVRRGDRVTLELGGDGFVIGMETIADADARDGRVALRSVAGGRRLYGVVGDDGRVRLRTAKSPI